MLSLALSNARRLEIELRTDCGFSRALKQQSASRLRGWDGAGTQRGGGGSLTRPAANGPPITYAGGPL
jgi:hypothetical protein